MSQERLRIVVTGYVIRLPLAGNMWCYLQYVAGLAELGHDVFFIEESGSSEFCCYDLDTNASGTDPRSGFRSIDRALKRFRLEEKWAYWDEHSGEWLGPCASKIPEIIGSADLLLRMPAMADSLQEWFRSIPVRTLIDHDPVFTQVRHLQNTKAMEDAMGYNAYFSFGENLGHGTAAIPDDGIVWQSTRPPVVLDEWRVGDARPSGAFSTILKWEAYARVEHEGISYGMKSQSFEAFQDLPGKTQQVLELAVGGDKTPKRLLEDGGWVIRDPVGLSATLESYQDYIHASKGELSIAKHGYVISRSGWLSERTGNYLAAGKPAIVQDTGLAERLGCEAGLLFFSTEAEALAAIEEVSGNYAKHCRIAREVAEWLFDSRKILDKLINEAFEQAG